MLVEASDANGLTTLRVTISGRQPLLLLGFELRIGLNADQLEVSDTRPALAFQTGTGGQPVEVPTTIETTPGDVLVMLERPLWLGSEGLVALVSYHHNRPISTADDSVVVQVAEAGLPTCTMGGAFPEVGMAGAGNRLLSLSLITPGGQLLDDPDGARFEAIPSLPAQQIDRVSFDISTSDGVLVWHSEEHRAAFCAFGGNERCEAPPEDWWAWLPEGRYQIRVTVYARGGGSASLVQTFEKLSPAYPPPVST
ncbi:MAG: hypothetical protein OHK0022_54440 [Roseiflexaceae bacterium]